MSRINAVFAVAAFPPPSSSASQTFLAPRRLAIAIAAALSQAWTPAHAQTPTVLTNGDIGPAVHSPNPSPSWAANNLLYVGNTATGSMSITDGGTVTNPGRGSIGHANTAVGTVTVSGTGSSWTMTGGMYVGLNGKGSLLIEQGGKVIVGPGVTAVGNGSASVGAVTVRDAGSEWKVDGNINLATFGTGTINLQNGGAVTTSNGTGDLSMGSASSAGLSSTLNIGAASSNPLDAMAPGTLNAASITMNRATATINFNHNATNYVFAPTVASAGSGTHAIHQIAGTTRLTGNNANFTGTTTVSGGALIVASTLGGDAVVNGGLFNLSGIQGGGVSASGAGEVAGSGSIAGNLIFSSGGVLTGKANQSLAVGGNLWLDGASTVNFAVESPLASAGGNLTLRGTLNVSSQNPLSVGVYRMFNYGGMLNGNSASMTIGAVPVGATAGQLQLQTAVPGQVNLIYTGGQALRFWDGNDPGRYNNSQIDGGQGSWSTAPGDASWAIADGAVNGAYGPAYAVFQGTAATVTVDQSAGAIGVTGMQLATDGYRIEGDPVTLQGSGGKTPIQVGNGATSGNAMTATIASVLNGSSQLVKGDLGTLVLSASNLYTGGTDVHAGTLQISSDANLGDAAGGLAMSGGTLATTANFDSDRAVTLTQTGQFNVAAGTQLGLRGRLSGSADLLKTGAGTLQLSNASNAYGNTLVRTGTLLGNAASLSGNIGNAATTIFDQSADASFAGDIGALDGIGGGMIKQGAGNLTLTGRSTLDWSVQAGTLTSAAGRYSGNADIAAVATLVFNQEADAAYGGALSGAGEFIKTGAGTLAYNGDGAGHVGATTVAGGTLLLGADSTQAKATLGGAMTVRNGATLAGHGSVGAGLTVASGGTVSPGNAGIGTLTVKGDLSFNDGARYTVQTDPVGSGADLVHATGKATLGGGSVAHIGLAGRYGLRATYKILSADGGLSGAFGGVTSSFAFLDPTLSYDANNAYLTLVRNETSFTSSGLTPNQNAAAGAIDSIGTNAGNPMYDAVALLPDDSAVIRRAFDQLSGEIHASAKTALIEDSHYLRDVATARMRSAFGDASAAPMMVAAYGNGGALPAAASAERPVAWFQGFGAWGGVDGDGNAARLTRAVGGFFIGADAPVGAWRLGALAGYSRNSLRAGDRASSGTSDNYHLGLYGGTQWPVATGRLGLRTGLAYTWHDIGTRRSPSLPGYDDSLKGSYSAGVFQVFGDLGYRIDAGRVSVEPYVNLAYVHLGTGRYKESGGAAALQADRQGSGTTYSTLGLRSSTAFELGGKEAALRGMLGWRHAFGEVRPRSTQSFSAGDAFTVTGVPIARNAAVLEAGADLRVATNATVGLSYDAMLASGAQQHGIRADFTFRF